LPKPHADCSKREQLMVTFTAGHIAGVLCILVSHPADVVVTKLNQSKSSNLGNIVRNLRFTGLWQGLTPRIIMIDVLTALQWFIYDGVKVALAIPRHPPPVMPASLKAKLDAVEEDNTSNFSTT
jgi:solute carrier family 25 (mitochondrial phosphate transporter), member 3